MFMRRVIAAKGYAANLAGTQVYPLLIMFNTFLANMVVAEFYSFYCKQVLAELLICHVVKIRNTGIYIKQKWQDYLLKRITG